MLISFSKIELYAQIVPISINARIAYHLSHQANSAT